MRNYFGTDGIRGIVNKELDCTLAFKCGNALTCLKNGLKVVIGKDGRKSCDMLFCAFSAGVMSGGGTVYDLGIIPTAGVAYSTKNLGADFGVVISASHNPKEYNGIKIFGSDGYKLSDEKEIEIESKIGVENFVENDQIGKLIDKKDALIDYKNSIISNAYDTFNGIKIVLDLSNGASSVIAPEIFNELGAQTVVLNNDNKSGNINNNCGCLYPEVIKKAVKEYNADLAVAFDGDSDRLIVCDEKGSLVNGDMIVYILSKYFKEKGLLNKNLAIGTLHTNMGVEKAIKSLGIDFMRSDIGDRYVIELMKKTGAILGGEQSGHIIIGNKSTTGDGILTAVILCCIMKEKKQSLYNLSNVLKFPQENINVLVTDKAKVLQNEQLKELIKKIEKEIDGKGRILVRASGTEPKIRIMAECESETLTKKVAEELANFVNEIANID